MKKKITPILLLLLLGVTELMGQTNQSLLSWGGNRDGQLGNGVPFSKIKPFQNGESADWKMISSGREHTLAIKQDGTLWVWGWNNYGELGAQMNSMAIPVKIGTDNDWKVVSAGENHSMAIKEDGTLWCWGRNTHGQVGDGTTVSTARPIRIGEATDWASVSAGSLHSTAIKTDGTLWVWGYFGYLGDGTYENKFVPAQIGSTEKWKTVSAGKSHTIAIKNDGSLWAWGANSYFQLGDDTSEKRNKPVQIGGGTDWNMVSAGEYYSVALKNNGTIWGWGENFSGQLGDGTSLAKRVPVQIGSSTDWRSISAGRIHTVAIKNDGSLWGWGYNEKGQVGDGTIFNKYSPSRIGSATDWQSVSVGGWRTMAIKKDGTLWGWGAGERGQLGDKTVYPDKIGSQTDWAFISAGVRHTMAIRQDGTLWGWGYNSNGQLGNGTLRDKIEPVQIGSANDWKIVETGWDYTQGIKQDGTLWAWGRNDNGQLGDGTSVSKIVPVQIGSSTDWKNLSSGEAYVVALKQDGSLWAWGSNFFGSNGDGTTTQKNEPVQIGTDRDWALVSAYHTHSVALKENGTLWAWGNNGAGQLGDGSTNDRHSPVQVGEDTDWQLVSAGAYFTVAIKNDGTLWTWGSNREGQLGDRTFISTTTPIKSGTGTNWVSISAGEGHVLALRKDGTLWAWGNNGSGQVGNGQGGGAMVSSSKVPEQIGSGTGWVSISAGTSHSTALFSNLKGGLPNLHKPQRNSVGGADIEAEFSLPSEAKAGTVQLAFIRNGGEPDPHSPHIITFDASFETEGRHSTLLKGSNLGAQPGVSAVNTFPNDALVNGTKYKVKVSYLNNLSGVVASDSINGFLYDPDALGTLPKPLLAIASDTGPINSDGITSDNTPEIVGKVEKNAKVFLYLNGTVIGSTFSDPYGNWFYVLQAAEELPDGKYKFKIVTVDDFGNSKESDELLVTIDTQAPLVRKKDVHVKLGEGGVATVSVQEVNDLSFDEGSMCNTLTFGQGQSFFISSADKTKVLGYSNGFVSTDPTVKGSFFLKGSGSEEEVVRVGEPVRIVLTETGDVLYIREADKKLVFGPESTSPVNDWIVVQPQKQAGEPVDFGGDFLLKSNFELDGKAVYLKLETEALFVTVESEASTLAVIPDGFSFNCDLSFQLAKTTFTCSDLGIKEVQLKVNDLAGNSSSSFVNVRVEDTLAPNLQVSDFTTVTETTFALSEHQVSAIDKCSTGEELTFFLVSDPLAGRLQLKSNVGIPIKYFTLQQIRNAEVLYVNTDNTKTIDHFSLYVKDGSFNTSEEKTISIILQDGSKPEVIVKDVTLSLQADGTVSITPLDIDNGTTDNRTKPEDLQLSLNRTSFGCDDVGKALEVVLSAVDGEGNTGSSTAKVVIIDRLSPELEVQNVELQLNKEGLGTLSEAAAVISKGDNCQVPVIRFSRSSFSCEDLGAPFSVKVLAEDGSGNITEKEIFVTVLDKQAPEVLTENVTLYLDENGHTNLTALVAGPNSFDNCGLAEMSLNKTSFSCADLGLNEVELTVTDKSGNTTTATTNVHVKDLLSPIVVTQNIRLSLGDNGEAYIFPEDVNFGSSDNCKIVEMSLDKTSFSCGDIGNQTVTLKVVDGSGNSSTATAIVSVEDPLPPKIIEGLFFYVEENSKEGLVVGQVTAIDNCILNSWTINYGNSENGFQIDSKGSIIINNAAALNYEHNPEFNLSIEVEDRVGNKTSDEILIKLINVNEAPILNVPIKDQQEKEDAFVSFSIPAGTFVDEDQDDELFLAVSGLPSGFEYDPATAKISGVSTSAGTYTIIIKATDKSGEFAEDVFVLEILPVNDPPVFEKISNMKGKEMHLISFSVTATDEDNNNSDFEYSLKEAPSGASVDPSKGIFSWVPTEDQGPEIYLIKIAVSDGKLTDEQEFTITINEVNQAPVFTSQPLEVAKVGEEYFYKLEAQDGDLPVNTLTYGGVEIPAWLSFDPSTQVLSGIPDGSLGAETFLVRLQVGDGIEAVFQEFNIQLERPTGLFDKEQNNSNVFIYPNPTSGRIMIEWEGQVIGEGVEVSLLDLGGRVLFQYQGNLIQGAEEAGTYLQEIKAGVYLIQLKAKDQLKSLKLIKK